MAKRITPSGNCGNTISGVPTPAQRAIRWLSDGGYVETTPVTHLLSPEDEYLVTKITDTGRLLLKKKPVENVQAKLLDAQVEEIEAR
jgi:hypothetical protein